LEIKITRCQYSIALGMEKGSHTTWKDGTRTLSIGRAIPKMQ